MKKILIPLIISIFANAAEPVIGEKKRVKSNSNYLIFDICIKHAFYNILFS